MAFLTFANGYFEDLLPYRFSNESQGAPGWELSGCREFPNPAPNHLCPSAVTLHFLCGFWCSPVCITPWRCVHTLWGATRSKLWCKNEVSASWDRRGSPHPGLGAGLRGRGPDPSPQGRGSLHPLGGEKSSVAQNSWDLALNPSGLWFSGL